MQVTETSAEGLKREFKITVPATEVEDQISRRLGEIGQSVRIPGFRPGKVPLPLLRKRYGPAVRHEVLESTVQGSSAEAMREQNLRPALPPQVEIVSAAEGADLEYKMSVEVLPDMPEPNFGDLGIERLVAEVPEDDIDRALERIAESQRKQSRSSVRRKTATSSSSISLAGPAMSSFPAARARTFRSNSVRDGSSRASRTS